MRSAPSALVGRLCRIDRDDQWNDSIVDGCICALSYEVWGTWNRHTDVALAEESPGLRR